MLKTMNLKRILVLGSGLIGFILVINVLSTRWMEKRIVTATVDRNAASWLLQKALQSKFYIAQIQQFITDASLTFDEESIKSAQTIFEALKKTLNEIEIRFPEIKTKTNGIVQESDALYKVGIEMYRAYREGGKAAGDAIMKRAGSGLDDQSETLAKQMDDFVGYATQLGDAAEKAEEGKLSQLTTNTIFLGFLTFALVALVLWTMISRVAPLKDVIENVAEAGTNLELASHEISASANNLSSTSMQSAASLKVTTDSVKEVAQITHENVKYANQAQELAKSADVKAKKGQDQVATLIASIGEMAESSRKIEEILTVIDTIAFQTNLLALNAAVEAARAGEQGKGFAVVAEAVRNLSQKSASSAKEITTLIKNSVEKINSGVSMAEQTQKSMASIVQEISQVNGLNTQIADACAQQAQGIDSINSAIQELDQTTQSNSAISEQTAAASEELSSQSTVLKNMVTLLKNSYFGETKK